MVRYCLVIWIWLLEEKRAWTSSEGKWELERLCVVHSSRVHAYFSVIWIYFVFLCGLVQAATLGLHFLFFFIFYLFIYFDLCSLKIQKASKKKILGTYEKTQTKSARAGAWGSGGGAVSVSSWEENKDLRIEERHWSGFTT